MTQTVYIQVGYETNIEKCCTTYRIKCHELTGCVILFTAEHDNKSM